MADDSRAQRRPRRIVLLSLCGLTPAVITETVWALAEIGQSPERILVATTQKGETCLRRDLFESGRWDALAAELESRGLPPPRFGPTRDAIHTVCDRQGRIDAPDITGEEETAEFGDFLLGLLRQHTENADTSVILSIAGGRKTMSAIASQCMSLLAREHDRIVHVLVNEPFDDPRLDPPFYFPSETVHRTPDGDEVMGTDAVICLHDMPFIRCRSLFQDSFRRLPGTFRDTVAQANCRIQRRAPEISLDLRPASYPVLHIDGMAVTPGRNRIAAIALYWMLCERRIEGRPPLRGQQDLLDHIHEFLGTAGSQVQCTRLNRMPSLIHVLDAMVKMTDADDLKKIRSDLDRSIRATVAPAVADQVTTNSPGRGVYGLEVDPAAVTVLTAGSGEDGRPA